MGFLDRLFARHGSQEEIVVVLYEGGRRDKDSDPRPWDNRTSLKVAGESHYQPALCQITGRQGSEAVKMEDVEVELVCEPDNKVDPLAVKVEIDGLHVGYLSRGNARRYCRRIEREGGRVLLSGFVGCQEDGMIGVRVHVPDEHPIARALG